MALGWALAGGGTKVIDGKGGYHNKALIGQLIFEPLRSMYFSMYFQCVVALIGYWQAKFNVLANV